MKTRRLELIGAAVGEGAADARTASGPGSLRQWGLGRRLAAAHRQVRWGPVVRTDPTLQALGALAVVAEFAPRLARAVAHALRTGWCPVVLGGDHSCALGTWSGVSSVVREGQGAGRPAGALGLIWIDAHLDAHTPETSETQNPHGMPMAALLGHGPPGFTQVCVAHPKLDPAHVVLIGPRSWEAGEAALLQRLGVRVMAAQEVGQRGLRACLVEALARVKMGTQAWGLSVDLDALDPSDAPGTGVRVAHGLRLADLVQALRGLALDPDFVACEVVEYNPKLDHDRRTAWAAQQVLAALWADV